VFPLGRPPDRVIEYTIGLRLPRVGEWMGEPQRAVYPSMIDFHLGYHQAWAREQGTHRSVPGYHHEFVVMPLGLTNALVTFQSFMQCGGTCYCYLMPSLYAAGRERITGASGMR
jgi:hypothetical protein